MPQRIRELPDFLNMGRRDGYKEGMGPNLAWLRVRPVGKGEEALPLQADARAELSRPVLNPRYCTVAPRMMLTADQMRTLPDFLADIADPRRAQGKRHPLPSVLAIATAAVLCGIRNAWL